MTQKRPKPSSTALAAIERIELSHLDPEVVKSVKDAFARFQAEGIPRGTLRAYERDVSSYIAWAHAWRREALLSETPRKKERVEHERTLLLYLTYLADQKKAKANSIDRALAAICASHKYGGRPNPRTPAITQHLKMIRRAVGSELNQSAPLLIKDLSAIVDALGQSPRDQRDRALLLVGWGAAMRRSEIAALDMRDVRVTAKGVVVKIRRSKIDQERRGVEIRIPRARVPELCASVALERWLVLRKPHGGEHLFCKFDHQQAFWNERMKDSQIETIFRIWPKRLGLKPEDPDQNFSPHSLRSGFITEAARAGRTSEAIMQHSRHKTHSALMMYIRKARGFENHPGEGLL